MSKNVYIFFRTRTFHLLYPQYAPASFLAVDTTKGIYNLKKYLYSRWKDAKKRCYKQRFSLTKTVSFHILKKVLSSKAVNYAPEMG